jgi:hypothetical protein
MRTLITYILVEAGIVKVDWVGPCTIIPDIISPDIEASGEDAFLIRHISHRNSHLRQVSSHQQ